MTPGVNQPLLYVTLTCVLIQGRTTTPGRGSASPGTWPCVWLPAGSSTAPCATVEPSRRRTSGSTWRASSTKLKCQSWDTAMRWRTSATAKGHVRRREEERGVRERVRQKCCGAKTRPKCRREVVPCVRGAYLVKGLAQLALEILLQFIWYKDQTLDLILAITGFDSIWCWQGFYFENQTLEVNFCKKRWIFFKKNIQLSNGF